LADPASSGRQWWKWLATVLGIVIFAYGFGVTRVNLEQIRDETRTDNLVRILRALARPELLEQDAVETATDIAIQIPCSADGADTTSAGDRQLNLEPSCADPRATITVSGSGFGPNIEVGIFLIPESQVSLRLAEVRTDGAGAFVTQVRLPNRPSDEPQTIRAISEEAVGQVRWTQTARDTLRFIIETIFLALIATTFATALAVPLSFFAARNLMEDISSPVTNVALALIATPLGIVVGALASIYIGRFVDEFVNQPLLVLVAGLLAVGLSIWLLRQKRTTWVWLAVFLLAVLTLHLSADLLLVVGQWLEPRLGPFDFLGGFIAGIGDLLSFGLVVLAALIAAGGFVVASSRFGHRLRRTLSSSTLHSINLPLAAMAGALWALLVARGIAWFYQWVDATRTTWIPLVLGGLVGLIFGWRARRRHSVRIGLAIYYLSRTVFNVLRALEPLILAIVFVVWVGLGPFAGALALAAHTIAALAKLYSEQVESIASGPLEAIRATGANRLQNVVYGVVPQIIPPYISFTMYRWDINVRMSTIIGFVGGGGIGFLLQQNINLLDYRAAAAQILAIAIVVASMDWLSSRIRARYV
jgi:phosphonate ABC transporter permease subunit PhnE